MRVDLLITLDHFLSPEFAARYEKIERERHATARRTEPRGHAGKYEWNYDNIRMLSSM